MNSLCGSKMPHVEVETLFRVQLFCINYTILYFPQI